MSHLTGQVALVSGAGGGIGRGIVRRFLREGAQVCAFDIDTERLQALRGEFQSGVLLCNGDVSRWEDNRAAVAACLESFGRLDVFIGNAAIYDHGIRLEDISGERLAEACAEMFKINVGGYLLGVRAALEALRESGGSVILTGSYASSAAGGGGALYTASKHAVLGLVRQLANELAPKVRVNGVAPGVAATVLRGVSALDQVARSALLPGTESLLPLQRMPEADDFAGLYTFLANRTDAAHITGSLFTADSGLSIKGLA